MRNFASLAAILVCCVAAGADEPVDFNRQIRPILAKNCFFCHGSDKEAREAELRMDVPSEHLGKLARRDKDGVSELMRRLESSDPDEHMPPPAAKRPPLSAEQLALIRRWVDQGATLQSHWAYVPPKRSEPPEVDDPTWARTPIDRFIAAGHQAAGLSPSPEADRRTLIRRLSLDLTGLPPSPDEVEAFVGDQDPAAYERLVDRLLRSPAYGERMAAYWLDLVRYGDTHGFHSDIDRNISPYRDWVIHALNNNMPFDQFTVWQLAGDLLPEATLEQRIASGYNRLNMTTSEGGAQAKEYLAKYATDRVSTTSVVWLASTMGCAECHDHKFDPFTQKDFYRFTAFFNDLKQQGLYPNTIKQDPEIPVPTDQQQEHLQELRKQIARLQARIEQEKKERESKSAGGSDKKTDEPVDYVWLDDALPAGAKPDGSEGDKSWSFVSAPEHPVHGGKHSSRRQADALSQHYFTGAKEPLTIAAGEKLFAHVYLDPNNPPAAIMLQFNDGSWEHRAYWGEDRIPYGSGNPKAKTRLGDLPAAGKWVRLEVPVEKVHLAPGAKLNGMAFTQFGGTVYWDTAGLETKSPPPQPSPLEKELAGLKQQEEAILNDAPRTLVAMTGGNRVARVFPRGNWLDESGEVVTAGVPGILPSLPDGKDADRLALGRWLVSRDNPLTARVMANRYWMLLFGQGLVRTPGDFGTLGTPPTHPELLDWLAVEFMDSGWDTKHLLKTIVMSAAYRQSSRPTPALLDRDPKNLHLARQNQFRLDAEMIRDGALAASGLLSAKLYGPSVKPYQPDGIYVHCNTFGAPLSYKLAEGDDLYRRGLYTYWKRTVPYPSFIIFDAPSREVCTVQRSRSNTPLQALVLLNDPTYVEAARVLAARMIAEGGATERERIDFAFRRVLSRTANDEEATILAGLRGKHLAEYQGDEPSARKLLAVGNAPLPPQVAPAELSAWTSVARTILNLQEAITRY